LRGSEADEHQAGHSQRDLLRVLLPDGNAFDLHDCLSMQCSKPDFKSRTQAGRKRTPPGYFLPIRRRLLYRDPQRLLDFVGHELTGPFAKPDCFERHGEQRYRSLAVDIALLDVLIRINGRHLKVHDRDEILPRERFADLGKAPAVNDELQRDELDVVKWIRLAAGE